MPSWKINCLKSDGTPMEHPVNINSSDGIDKVDPLSIIANEERVIIGKHKCYLLY